MSTTPPPPVRPTHPPHHLTTPTPPHSHTPTLREPPRKTPVTGQYDVVVCGGGPAGVAAAVAAARAGASVLLLEQNHCLGGIWTAGAVSWLIDHGNKPGLMAEIVRGLDARGARDCFPDGAIDCTHDAEMMKEYLDALVLGAGVRVRLHTHAVAAIRDAEGRLSHVATESKSGREAWAGKVFVDCTGDGDVAALAGCGFDLGHPDTGDTQPMSLTAILSGLRTEEIRPFLLGQGGDQRMDIKQRLRAEIERGGVSPSYTAPVLFQVWEGIYSLDANHQYGVLGTSADDLTRATMEARAEVHRIVRGLRSLGGPWANLRLVATSSHIGVREARRIHGRYTVTADDLIEGARHDDAVCRVTFCVDIHSTRREHGGAYHAAGIKVRPYDIPLRALIARDVDSLMMAGRCISGDFFAHASYRVTGNAVAMGEAAGKVAARAAATGRLPHEVPWGDVARSAG